MKLKLRTAHCRLLALLALILTMGAVTGSAADYPVRPVPFTDVRITGGFWKERQETNRLITVPYALRQCEETKRLANFDLAAETLRRRAAGETNFQNKPLTLYPFDDSDVYKAVEGAAYALSIQKDPALEAHLDKIIDKIAAAQEPDGYLYTFRTMHPDSPAHEWINQKRWLNDPILSHELYNLGHLYEAGVAYYQATGKRKLLDVCLKSADLVDRDFGGGKLRIAPGHQVIEMGLVKLYRVTGEQKYLRLARFFLDVRGPGEDPYNQRHLRVTNQTEAVGHAVRANYMYSGMADVAALTGDSAYFSAITKIWNNVVEKKMHLTGGVGARAAGEAYGDDYELPNKCYNESCAAIAFLMWNHRMFLLTGDGKYMDVFERTLYNGFPSGVSLSGDRFFYPNPLVYDGHSVNNHGYAGRAPWFGCACCPPNILRTMAALTGYFYAVKDDHVFVNLYAQSEGTLKVKDVAVTLVQETAYPWNGKVTITVAPEKEALFSLGLRIPEWTLGRPVPGDLYFYRNSRPAPWTVKVNGSAVQSTPEHGYVLVSREWKKGDVVELNLPMPVRKVRGNDRIAATKGRIALERGPIVYCLEGIDNDQSVDDCVLSTDARIASVYKGNLGGYAALIIKDGGRAERDATSKVVTKKVTLQALPYALWNNRGLSPMEVWIAASPEYARLKPLPTLSFESRVSVSFHRNGMALEAINDQLLPLNATDGFASNFDFWPHKGTTEWIQYDFKQSARVSESTVMWFDDTGSGECRLPASWRLLYQDGSDNWKPVEGVAGYPVTKGKSDRVTFHPVTTGAMRLEVQLPKDFSSGVWEWTVK